MNVTITNPPKSVENSPLSSVREPRFDAYGPIHKAMRVALSDVLVRLGTTNFSAPAAVARILKDLGDLLVACEKHIEHEERFVHPHVLARLPQALGTIDQGHDDHARFVAELRALMDGVTTASTNALRALAGRTLYLHYTAFFADTLAHMVEEERVLQPLIHRVFSDEELLAIHGAILASMSPEEQFASLMSIAPAVNGPERAAVLFGVHAEAPPQAFAAIVGALRSRLDEESWSELASLCPLVG